ncbi:protein APCDD1 [Calliopsis andreniformis]|uniref:protein APCDD1 n=1 Tax=Calliopsis andreniformis TaxID=337506 RepID=UPI003FCE47EB
MNENMMSLILFFFMEFSYIVFAEPEREEGRCIAIMEEIISKDRATVTDNTSSRLHSTWLSQECEIRAGPEYMIRKYTFFENGTFHLLRYHYAEESCSIATYTIVARGSIEILLPSAIVPGASEANVQVNSVHLIPHSRRIAHKFGRRLNASCGGIEDKWRPYVAQLIYERPIDVSSNTNFQIHWLNSNSFKSRLPRQPRKPDSLDCLESLGIEFNELSLLRVEMRSDLVTNLSNHDPREMIDKPGVKVQLLFGEITRNGRSQKPDTQKPNRLQSTALLRANTAAHCPVCKDVFRSTEYSPPLYHQIPSLPAVIYGTWLSVRCESIEGGFWSRRILQVYSSNQQWSARWTYYVDSTCSTLLYTITAAGTYVQRAIRRKPDGTSSHWRNDDDVSGALNSDPSVTFNDVRVQLKRAKGVKPNVRHRTLQDIIREEPTVQSMTVDSSVLPLIRRDNILLSGTTELELHIFKSRSVPVDKMLSSRCTKTGFRSTKRTSRIIKNGANSISSFWQRSCTPRTIETGAILKFKARINLDWNGDYILLLASWNDLWEAPLRRCSETTLPNYLQGKQDLSEFSHGHISAFSEHHRFNQRGLYWFTSSGVSCHSINFFLSVLTLFLSY